MTTCIIADDEAHLARYLKDQLASAWPALQVLEVLSNGVEAAKSIEKLAPDLAFLDIQMPGMTGLDVAQGIETATRVVFVTAYDEYALQAFDQGAIDYLLKPVTAERIAKTVTRLKEVFSNSSTNYPDLGKVLAQINQKYLANSEYLRWVRANVGELTYQIPVADILYFDASDKYTCVYSVENSKLIERLIRMPIQELEAQLDPREFSRIHRSTIVNLNHVHATRRDDTGRLFVRMKETQKDLPVSRAYHDVFNRM
jgi:DNA-binding LytR/AlgR family response regulator